MWLFLQETKYTTKHLGSLLSIRLMSSLKNELDGVSKDTILFVFGDKASCGLKLSLADSPVSAFQVLGLHQKTMPSFCGAGTLTQGFVSARKPSSPERHPPSACPFIEVILQEAVGGCTHR